MSAPASSGSSAPSRPIAESGRAAPTGRGPRPAARASARGARGAIPAADLALYAAGVLVLAALGYVAWRTEVRGEKLAEVLPFLAEKPTPAASGVAEGAPGPGGAAATPGGRPGSAPRTAPAGDPGKDDNTLFGRRVR